MRGVRDRRRRARCSKPLGEALRMAVRATNPPASPFPEASSLCSGERAWPTHDGALLRTGEFSTLGTEHAS